MFVLVHHGGYLHQVFTYLVSHPHPASSCAWGLKPGEEFPLTPVERDRASWNRIFGIAPPLARPWRSFSLRSWRRVGSFLRLLSCAHSFPPTLHTGLCLHSNALRLRFADVLRGVHGLAETQVTVPLPAVALTRLALSPACSPLPNSSCPLALTPHAQGTHKDERITPLTIKQLHDV